MSALEIVMVSVVSVLVFCIVLYFIIQKLFKKLASDKAKDFKILNKYAQRERIVFLGDSLTDFFPLNDFFPDLDIYNRGIAGDNTFDIMKRLEGIIELKPQKLFLLIGINDFHKRKIKPEEMIERIFGIVEALSEVPHIYIISLFPLNKSILRFTWFFRNKANNALIRRVNRLLEEKCLVTGYPFINVYNNLIDENDNLKREFTLDGIHLSTNGYEEVVQKLKPYLYD
ncbi:MAG: GDSL-type esterase/lipase family protein [Bacilli bacterium]|jgi:lysophospholipase L1-like esterase|nr:GDSL-type esterase/lipase family protein [Bacilli bacterium]HHU24310.1 hypothetical protein [Acholeplasmataceae bacterium]